MILTLLQVHFDFFPFTRDSFVAESGVSGGDEDDDNDEDEDDDKNKVVVELIDLTSIQLRPSSIMH